MKLSDWLEINRTTPEMFAHQIGTHPLSVRRYLLGERKPKSDILDRIAEVTGGEVTANDFWHRKSQTTNVAA